jgi:hypothetical protein
MVRMSVPGFEEVGGEAVAEGVAGRALVDAAAFTAASRTAFCSAVSCRW